MKAKFTVLSLIAALAIPAGAWTISQNVGRNVAFASRTHGISATPTAVNPNAKFNAPARAEGEPLVWDFEDAAQFNDFTLVDADGDGNNWAYFNNNGASTQLKAHSGDGLIYSMSYNNDSGALKPNNWLISPEVTLGGTLSFWATGQDENYCDEVFGVYVVEGNSTTPADFTQVGADFTATGEYVLYEIDLNAYAGKTGRFAIVHHNVTDQFYLNVDDITLDVNGVATPYPTMPTGLTATPTATTADIAWTAGDNNGSWNLRYRPYVDITETNRLWDFPADTYSEQLNGWLVFDADGDGYNWSLAYSDEAGTDVCLYSASYVAYNALTPDNWMITPVVKFGGTLKFKAWNGMATYPEKIQVYLSTEEDVTNVDSFVAISDFIQPGEEAQEYTIDLSAYEGTGRIAFRHYDCTDQYRIYLDDIEITVPDAKEIAEWVEVDGATSPTTIEDLTPETEYEVQVMAINVEGDKTTAWSESTHFTTLAEEVEEGISEFYLVGSFNGWNWENEDGRVPMEEVEGGYAATIDLEAGAEFKIITPDETAANGFTWFGGVDETGVGYFLVTEELLEAPITLVDGANFRIENAGNYTITIKEAPATIGGIKAPFVMTVAQNSSVAVNDINVAKTSDNAWYNIQGMKLNGVPTTAGIYINAGKKIVVK